MSEKSKIKLTNVLPFLKRFLPLFPLKKQKPLPQTEHTYLSKLPSLSLEKQKELDALCTQLFKKKELIASGKLQLIGLEKIKDRMGTRWEKLCATVYSTAEDVITQHIGKGDVFIRYRGNSYVIIFAHASLREAETKAVLIVDEIKRRLFALDDDDLKGIEIKGIAGAIQANHFAAQGFPAVLDTTFPDSKVDAASEEPNTRPGDWQSATAKKEKTVPRVAAVDLDREIETDVIDSHLNYPYVPLWDVRRGALTTYLCMPHLAASEEKGLAAYQEFYNKRSAADRVQLDLKTLEVVIEELILMEQDSRRLFVICPVHHETLSHLEYLQSYKELCQKIPSEQKKFLIFMIIDMPEGLAVQEPYRFVAPLKNFCAQVFAKGTLGGHTNFKLLKDSGIDGVGVWASDKAYGEEKAIDLLNTFCAGAKAGKMNKTFILDVSSLSLTTSAVCAGYDYLGGSGIHDDVDKPDNVYRYRHEDLISELIKK